MSKPLFLGALFLALISGVGFGLFVGSGSYSFAAGDGPPPSSTPLALSASTAEAATDPLKSRVQELETELSEQKREQDALIMADRLAMLKKDHCNIFALDQGLKIQPAMADILMLTAEERQAVEQHLAEIFAQTQRLEDDKTVLLKQYPDSVTYQIPAYPEGKELQSKLFGFLSTDIGEGRAEVFEDYCRDVLQSQFSNFGAQKEQIEVKKVPPPSPNETAKDALYQLNVTYFDASGNFAYGMEYKSGDPLPQHYAKLIAGLSR